MDQNGPNISGALRLCLDRSPFNESNVDGIKIAFGDLTKHN
jgi:hypothetical protein